MLGVLIQFVLPWPFGYLAMWGISIAITMHFVRKWSISWNEIIDKQNVQLTDEKIGSNDKISSMHDEKWKRFWLGRAVIIIGLVSVTFIVSLITDYFLNDKQYGIILPSIISVVLTVILIKIWSKNWSKKIGSKPIQ